MSRFQSVKNPNGFSVLKEVRKLELQSSLRAATITGPDMARRTTASPEDKPYLQVVDLTIKIALQPYASADPMSAIKTEINKMLFKYNEALGGVPLAYQDISFPPGKEYGRIYADQPWVYVEVVLNKMLVFCPIEDTILPGTISKVLVFGIHFMLNLTTIFIFKISETHVSILVLGMFNASISGHEMLKRFIFDASNNTW